MTMLRSAPRHALAAGIVLAGLSGSATVALAQSEALRSKSPEAAQIEGALAQSGAVRVLVGHSTPTGILTSGLADAEAAVANVQADILRSLAPGTPGAGSLRRMKYTPVFAVTVSRAELDRLAADQRVTAIVADKLEAVRLDQSGRIVDPRRLTGLPPSGADGSGTMIAIIDSGVDVKHAFLGGRVTAGACFSTTDTRIGTRSVCPSGRNSETGPVAGAACPANVTGCDHGTHVAGIAAGRRTGSGPGPVAGVAPGAKVMAIQVFSRIDSEATCTRFGYKAPCALTLTSDQIAALEYVITQVGRTSEPIAAVNMSIGGGEHAAACEADSRRIAIERLRSAGVATIVASGNNGFMNAANAPACVRGAIAVGSVTKTDGISSFSNASPIVSLLAPGTDIVSSVPGGRFVAMPGTSMAAPHVAGAIAVIRGLHPAASVDQIEAALKQTGKDVRDTRTGGRHAAKRIRVDLALDSLGGSGVAVAPAATPAATPASTTAPPAPSAATPTKGPVTTPTKGPVAAPPPKGPVAATPPPAPRAPTPVSPAPTAPPPTPPPTAAAPCAPNVNAMLRAEAGKDADCK